MKNLRNGIDVRLVNNEKDYLFKNVHQKQALFHTKYLTII